MPEGMNLSWNGRDGEVLDNGYGDWFAKAMDEDRVAKETKRMATRRGINPQQFAGAPERDDARPLAQTEVRTGDPLEDRLRRMGASDEGPSPRDAMKRLGFD